MESSVSSIPGAGRLLRLVPLLLLTGFFLGLTFPLGKLAAARGVSPLAYALALSLGAGLALAVLARGAGGPGGKGAVPLGWRVRYGLLAGLFTVAAPNALLFFVMPRIGAGLAAVLYALPPVLTLVIAGALGMERPRALRVAGVALGLAGALAIALPHPGGAAIAPAGWLALAFLIPLSLALGNVYRSLDWPPGAAPVALGASMGLGGALWIALVAGGVALFGDGIALIESLGRGGLVIAAQVVASGIAFYLYFRLQREGGPVFFSQVSYVNAAVGLVAAVALFGERYPAWIWAAIAAIFAGVVLVAATQPQAPGDRPPPPRGG